jgi:hypothetical protein
MDGYVRRALLLLGVLVWAHAAVAAPPDPRKEQSRAAFLKGVELVQKGDFISARGAFVEAHKLFPHPSILLNLGIVRARLGEFVDAEQDLVRFLADDGGATPDEIKSARQTLADVRTHLGTLKVRVEPVAAHATLDDKPVALAPGELAEVRVVVGDHVLVLEAPGFVTERTTVRVDATEPTVVVRSLALSEDVEKPSAPLPIRTIVGVSLLGASGVSLLVAIGTGLRAVERADAYNVSTSPEYRIVGVRDEGVAFRTTTDVLLVSAVLLGGAGALVLLWPTRASTAGGAPKVSATVGFGWVGVRGAF